MQTLQSVGVYAENLQSLLEVRYYNIKYIYYSVHYPSPYMLKLLKEDKSTIVSRIYFSILDETGRKWIKKCSLFTPYHKSCMCLCIINP